MKMKTVSIFMAIFGSFTISYSQEWIIAAYQNQESGTSIVAKRIDLASKQEINTITIPIAGQITAKEPIPVHLRNQGYYLIITSDGEPGKNCVSGTPLTRYAILDSSMNIVTVDSLLNMGIFEFDGKAMDTLIFDYFEPYSADRYPTRRGGFIIGPQMNIERRNIYPDDFQPIQHVQIAGHENLIQLENPFLPISWEVSDRFDVSMFALDSSRSEIIDSLLAGNFLAYSQLFNISPLDSLLYVFSLSYDIPREGQRVQRRNDAPSFLKKYSTGPFTLVDSIYIPNIIPTDEYVRNEIGQCDQVGSFIVYYFFKSDDYRYFSPAMLFIFDTRTNEASWLRVGWR